jgi:hypothetical protein
MNPQSKQAYESTKFVLTRQQQLVLKALRESPAGLTRHEISEVGGLRLQSCCGRVSELLKLGIISLKWLSEDRYEIRATPPGKTAAVLVLA